MDIDSWLRLAIADAARRGLPELEPQLELLAHATRLLRAAPWNDNAAGDRPVPPAPSTRRTP